MTHAPGGIICLSLSRAADLFSTSFGFKLRWRSPAMVRSIVTWSGILFQSISHLPNTSSQRTGLRIARGRPPQDWCKYITGNGSSANWRQRVYRVILRPARVRRMRRRPTSAKHQIPVTELPFTSRVCYRYRASTPSRNSSAAALKVCGISMAAAWPVGRTICFELTIDWCVCLRPSSETIWSYSP